TGRAPRCSTTAAVAVKVIGLVITSSPGPTPIASSARWSAAVQELTASAWRHPMASADAFANSLTFNPVVSQPHPTHPTTAHPSSCPTSGAANGSNRSRVRSAFCVFISSAPPWIGLPASSAPGVRSVVVVAGVRQVHPRLGQDRAQDLGSILLQLLFGPLD